MVRVGIIGLGMMGRTHYEAYQEIENAQVVAIVPEKSDNPVTMKLNEWAAATYPIVRAHLDAARVLKIAVDKRPATTN